MDLGCTPFKTFFVITLPVIMPVLVSGWLLAFTLSLDDLVIASFASDPGATTLPMVVFSSVREATPRESITPKPGARLSPGSCTPCLCYPFPGFRAVIHQELDGMTI